MTKVTLNMNEKLLERVDAFANECSLNRTSAICVLCAQALQQNEVIAGIPFIQKIFESQQLDQINKG